MRRLLPRHPREVGKRGQVLVLLGIIWIGLGAGLIIAGEPSHYALGACGGAHAMRGGR